MNTTATSFAAGHWMLRAKNKTLEAELARTKTALEITGKVHALLEQLSESADTERRWKP